MKNKLTANNTILVLLVLTFLLQLIFFQEITFLHTTNITFIIAAIFLMIGLFWATLAVGTFDSLHFVKRSRKQLDEEDSDIIPLSKKVGKGYVFPLKIGAAFFFLCLFSLIGFYVF